MLRLGFLSRRLSPSCQVRDQLLELAVLILEQLQPTQLSHAEPEPSPDMVRHYSK